MTDYYTPSINAELSDVLREVWINDASGENGQSENSHEENNELLETPNNSLVLESDLFFNPPTEDEEVSIKEEEWVTISDKGSVIGSNDTVADDKREWPQSQDTENIPPVENSVVPVNDHYHEPSFPPNNNNNNIDIWPDGEKCSAHFDQLLPAQTNFNMYHHSNSQGHLLHPQIQSHQPSTVPQQPEPLQISNQQAQSLPPPALQPLPTNLHSVARLTSNQVPMQYPESQFNHVPTALNSEILFQQIAYQPTYNQPIAYAAPMTNSQQPDNSENSSSQLSFFSAPLMMPMPMFDKANDGTPVAISSCSQPPTTTLTDTINSNSIDSSSGKIIEDSCMNNNTIGVKTINSNSNLNNNSNMCDNATVNPNSSSNLCTNPNMRITSCVSTSIMNSNSNMNIANVSNTSNMCNMPNMKNTSNLCNNSGLNNDSSMSNSSNGSGNSANTSVSISNSNVVLTSSVSGTRMGLFAKSLPEIRTASIAPRLLHPTASVTSQTESSTPSYENYYIPTIRYTKCSSKYKYNQALADAAIAKLLRQNIDGSEVRESFLEYAKKGCEAVPKLDERKYARLGDQRFPKMEDTRSTKLETQRRYEKMESMMAYVNKNPEKTNLTEFHDFSQLKPIGFTSIYSSAGIPRIFSSSLECTSPACVSARIRNQKRFLKTKETQTHAIPRVIEAIPFPDMNDWPTNGGSLKVHRPHLCDQSRIIICRVLAYNKEMAKRLGNFVGSTPFAHPELLTAAMTGFKLTVVRQCEDKKMELLKCTDKGPFSTLATQRVREEARERLATIFGASDDEEIFCSRCASLKSSEKTDGVRRSERVHKQSTRFGFDSLDYDMKTRSRTRREPRKRLSTDSLDDIFYDDYIVIEEMLDDIICKVLEDNVCETDSSIPETPAIDASVKKRKVGRPPKKYISI